MLGFKRVLCPALQQEGLCTGGTSTERARWELGVSLVSSPGSPLVRPNTSHAVAEPSPQPRTALSQCPGSVASAQCNESSRAFCSSVAPAEPECRLLFSHLKVPLLTTSSRDVGSEHWEIAPAVFQQ